MYSYVDVYVMQLVYIEVYLMLKNTKLAFFATSVSSVLGIFKQFPFRPNSPLTYTTSSDIYVMLKVSQRVIFTRNLGICQPTLSQRRYV